MRRPSLRHRHVFGSILVAALLFAALLIGVEPGMGPVRGYAQGAPLRVALTVGFVPWQYKDATGKLTGFEVEMLRNIGRRLNREVEFIDVQWEGIFAGLQANKYDIIASAVSILCERQKIVDFSVPYYDTGVSITVRKGDGRVRRVEDLKGMVVGVAGAGTTSHLWLMENKSKYEIKDIRVYDKIVSEMIDLEVGRIDAVAETFTGASGYTKDKPVLEIRVRDLTAHKVAMVFRKGDALVAQVNPVINAIKTDGTIARLHREQFGFEVPAESSTVRVVAPVLVAADCK